MAIRVLLDGQDITEPLNAQFPLPSADNVGIHPDNSRSHWWDLMPAIASNETLKANFFNNDVGVHTLHFEEAGKVFEVRVLLRMKYSARNR